MRSREVRRAQPRSAKGAAAKLAKPIGWLADAAMVWKGQEGRLVVTLSLAACKAHDRHDRWTTVAPDAESRGTLVGMQLRVQLYAGCMAFASEAYHYQFGA